jgi:allantoin racemase
VQIKILFLRGDKEWLQEIAEDFTRVDVLNVVTGTPHLEYEFYEHIAIHKLLEHCVKAERDEYDGIALNCFYDPGLREARELLRIPVSAPCESSLHVASMLSAGKFSILIGRRKWLPKMADNARNYGFESKIASWRILDLTVPEMKNMEKTEAAILREAKAAVEEDMAECIVLGCTGMARQAERVQRMLGVPVLDPVIMTMKMAEMRALLWKRFGISHSKIGGYEGPPSDEFGSIFTKFYGKSP